MNSSRFRHFDFSHKPRLPGAYPHRLAEEYAMLDVMSGGRLPYQKPHPNIYVVGSGTEDTVQYAAEKSYGYSQVFTPIDKHFAMQREGANRPNRVRATAVGIGV